MRAKPSRRRIRKYSHYIEPLNDKATEILQSSLKKEALKENKSTSVGVVERLWKVDDLLHPLLEQLIQEGGRYRIFGQKFDKEIICLSNFLPRHSE